MSAIIKKPAKRFATVSFAPKPTTAATIVVDANQPETLKPQLIKIKYIATIKMITLPILSNKGRVCAWTILLPLLCSLYQ